MEELKLPIERLNQFLTQHEFKVEDPVGETAPRDMYAVVKVQLTGTKEMYRAGDKMTYITYTTFIQPSSPMMNTLTNMLMDGEKEKVIDNQDMTFYILNNRISDQLQRFLLYWGIENPVICTKVVNETNTNLNESVEMNNELDLITKKLVKDILEVFFKEKQGKFVLPEYFDEEEMVYTQSIINGFTLELNLDVSDDVEDFEIEGDLYYGDDLISIGVTVNPDMGEDSMDDLIGELIETVRHEIEHIVQNDNGMEQIDEPNESEEYYSQIKEIEAQRAGFKLRSEEKKTDFETLVRNWFNKYQHKHSLTTEQKERVIQKVISEK